MGRTSVEHTAGLLERDRERAALAQVLADAHGGRGRVAMIEAVAGTGKTSLLDVAEQLATQQGLRVLRARGTEIARDVPLAILRALFEVRIAELPVERREVIMNGAAAVLAGALGLAEPEPITDAALHHAAYWLVADMAGEEPLALLVDDLHWADVASIAALAIVAARNDDLPVAMVLAHRPTYDDAVAQPITELSLAADVRLHPVALTRGAVADLVTKRCGRHAIDARTPQLVFDATGGNPFLVTHLSAALADADVPLSAADLPDLTKSVSAALASVMRMRIARLGPEAGALARAVLVLGDDCAVGEACALAGVRREAGLRVAQALAGAGIFARERSMAFSHPLVRAAVDADLLSAERVELQERAVVTMLDAGAAPARVSELLLHTDPARDERAVIALCAAASAASAAAAPRRAAVLLRRALLEVPAAAPRAALLDDVIAAELTAGDWESCAEHIRSRLAQDAPGAHRAALIRSLGRVVMQVDGVPAAVALLDEQLQDLQGENRLLVEAEQAWMCMGYPPLSARLQVPLAAYAGLAGDTPAERAMLAMVGLAMSLAPGSPADRVAPILTRAFANSALLADQHLDSSAHSMAGYALLLTEQFELADAEMGRAIDNARQHGSASISIALNMRALARVQLGRLADAEGDALGAVEACSTSSGAMFELMAATAVGVVVDVRAERGDDAGATTVLVEHGLTGDLGADPGLRALLPRARAHLVAGRPSEALADALRAQAAYDGYEDTMNHSAIVESQARLALGDRSAALAAGEAQLERARTWGTPSIVSTALRITGFARSDAVGATLLEEAVALTDGTPTRLESARCLLALGLLRRRLGQRRAALDALRRSADVAQQIGARRVARRAHAEMRILGARPRRLAFSGADALTAAERRVAQLATLGRTNREIAQELYVTAKTVEHHLHHTYSKLGITSRTELAGALDARHATA